jgi:large subunit ribosomal protein L21
MVGEGANVTVGTPVVSGGKVEAKVLTQAKDRKVDVVKFNRRQNYKRMHGHRQPFTLIEITGISGAPAAAASEE